MTFDSEKLKQIIEAALLAAGKPLNIQAIQNLFDIADEIQPGREEISAALEDIEADLANRGYELKKVASGYRLQVREEFATWVSRLWEEKPQRYSRALLETLSLVAYRQPITRGEIEDIRGVAVSTNIMRTLLDRDWVRVVGHREVPGRPAMYATTKVFLDYFNLKSLNELPTLAEIRDLDRINAELDLGDGPRVEDEEVVVAEPAIEPGSNELVVEQDLLSEQSAQAPGQAGNDELVEAADDSAGQDQQENAAAESLFADSDDEGEQQHADSEPEQSEDASLPSNVIELPTT